VFKLLQPAEGRWWAVNGPHLVPLVRAGARFEKGRLIGRPKEAPDEATNEAAA
jgi:putative transposase